MAHNADWYEHWLERQQERELAQWLEFAEGYAARWLYRRNSANASPLNEQDLEDILSEIRIAVLRFKMPEHAECWKPCLTGFVQRVCERSYTRALRTRNRCLSLQDLPENLHPQVGAPVESLDDEAFLRCVAAVLRTMPAHHAAAFVLALEAEWAQALVRQGALGEDYTQYTSLAPLPDKAIAQILNLTPRAVIRARQHAREKLRKTLSPNEW
ncbi:MAG: sigma-70 family RNA polymerase sigma factor [Fimbriimonadales bacterium]